MENDKRLLLVPVNFTEYSENGAIYALNLARYLDADIVLLNCYMEPVIAVPGILEPYSFSASTESFKVIEQETERSLKAFKNTLEKQKQKHHITDVAIKYDMVYGFPDNGILTYAEQFDVDAIVMGFEKPEGFAKFGNITANVIEKAKVPVIAIPQGYEASVFKKPERVLYFTRVDDSDKEAIKRLSELVRFFNSKIICVHACLGESSEEQEHKMHEFKEFVVEYYAIENLECGILETGDIIDGLIRFINKRNIDVLAMNTKKRNRLLKMFTTDFTEKLLYHTNVPLMVYHVD